MRDAANRVLDRAISGTSAEIALHGGGQVLTLCLIQAGRGHHHTGRTKPTLEALRRDKTQLHRMQFVTGQSLDRGDLVAFGAESRGDTAVHRLAVEQHRAGTAIAGIATLLDAEPAELAQEGAQALPNTWLFFALV